MPLDPDGERPPRHTHCLDLPVGRHGLDSEPRCRPVDALRVERVDPDLVSPGEGTQQAIGLEANEVLVVRVAIRDRSFLAAPMILSAGDLMDILMQRAAK